MMFSDFQTRAFGKWILAGEHAVIRGKGALVFPLKTHALQLRYKASSSALKLIDSSMQEIFFKILEKACTLSGHEFKEIYGEFSLHSTLSGGRGMGASAALCVVIGRWFIAQNWIKPDMLHDFSKTLENHFHGISSGVDIIGVSAEKGMYFEKDKFHEIEQSWQPYWYLSYSGLGSATADCVQQVEALRHTNPSLFGSLDENMHQSVLQAKAALESHNEDRLEKLADAMHLANECFHGWGLIEKGLDGHMQSLIKLGALAVKPTGSGGGGYVLSLWKNQQVNPLLMGVS